MKSLFTSVTSIILLTACNSQPTITPTSETPIPNSTDTAITGTITTADYSPMAADGDAIITVQTSEDQTYTIQIPARINLCQATYPDSELEVGDQIQASGYLIDTYNIRPCESSNHFITKTNNVD